MKAMYAVAGVVVVAVLLAVGLGITQEAKEAPDQKAAKDCCPGCGMTMGDMKGGTDMSGRMKEMQTKMKAAGVSEETMKMHMAMMNAPLYLDSPEMLIGQAEALVLTDDQKTRLIGVVKDSRTKAVVVLTDAQRTALGPVPEKPMTMMEVRSEMMKKMAPAMEKAGKGRGVDSAMTK
ncbi:MAG TPA: hypothetical protein PK280_04755 [Planctomycetota bacterium]|nr:hypothetical protein [Planctomycetota bacterium]